MGFLELLACFLDSGKNGGETFLYLALRGGDAVAPDDGRFRRIAFDDRKTQSVEPGIYGKDAHIIRASIRIRARSYRPPARLRARRAG